MGRNWLAAAEPTDRGLLLPGRRAGRAADLLLAPDAVELVYRQERLSLSWGDLGRYDESDQRGAATRWGLVPHTSTRGGDPIGAALLTAAPEAWAMCKSMRGARSTRFFRDAGPIAVPLHRVGHASWRWRVHLTQLVVLLEVLAERPAWRAHLTDTERMALVVPSLLRSKVVPLEPGGVRSRTVDVLWAMRSVGLAHPIGGRPLPGDQLEPGEVAIAKTTAALERNRWRTPSGDDLAEVTRLVHEHYLEVEPWPFWPFAD